MLKNLTVLAEFICNQKTHKFIKFGLIVILIFLDWNVMVRVSTKMFQNALELFNLPKLLSQYKIYSWYKKHQEMLMSCFLWTAYLWYLVYYFSITIAAHVRIQLWINFNILEFLAWADSTVCSGMTRNTHSGF